MANPSGITIISVDRHDMSVVQFLQVIDTKTGEVMRDPDFPQFEIMAFEVNLVDGWVIHAARNSSGQIEIDTEEVRRKKTPMQGLRLDWRPDTPAWMVERYSNATLEDIEPEEPA